MKSHLQFGLTIVLLVALVGSVVMAPATAQANDEGDKSFREDCYDEDDLSEDLENTPVIKDINGEVVDLAEVFALMDPALC